VLLLHSALIARSCEKSNASVSREASFPSALAADGHSARDIVLACSAPSLKAEAFCFEPFAADWDEGCSRPFRRCCYQQPFAFLMCRELCKLSLRKLFSAGRCAGNFGYTATLAHADEFWR